MRAVHVGIGHNDDLMVAEFFEVKIFADSAAEGCDHIFNFFGA